MAENKLSYSKQSLMGMVWDIMDEHVSSTISEELVISALKIQFDLEVK